MFSVVVSMFLSFLEMIFGLSVEVLLGLGFQKPEAGKGQFMPTAGTKRGLYYRHGQPGALGLDNINLSQYALVARVVF